MVVGENCSIWQHRAVTNLTDMIVGESTVQFHGERFGREARIHVALATERELVELKRSAFSSVLKGIRPSCSTTSPVAFAVNHTFIYLYPRDT